MQVKEGRQEGVVAGSPAPFEDHAARTTNRKVYWVKEEQRSKTSSRHVTHWILRCTCDTAEIGEERWLFYW